MQKQIQIETFRRKECKGILRYIKEAKDYFVKLKSKIDLSETKDSKFGCIITPISSISEVNSIDFDRSDQSQTKNCFEDFLEDYYGTESD